MANCNHTPSRIHSRQLSTEINIVIAWAKEEPFHSLANSRCQQTYLVAEIDDQTPSMRISFCPVSAIAVPVRSCRSIVGILGTSGYSSLSSLHIYPISDYTHNNWGPILFYPWPALVSRSLLNMKGYFDQHYNHGKTLQEPLPEGRG